MACLPDAKLTAVLDDDWQRRTGAHGGSIELPTAPSARAAVDRLDDLGAVPALQEVDVSPRLVCPLALDDDQRDALASHLNRVRVAERVSGESASHAGPRGCLT